MSILSEIGSFFLGISSKTLAFIKGAVTALESNPQLQEIATTEVLKLENSAVSNVEKQAAASSSIAGQLAAIGLPIVQSQINLAIEAAVANLPKAATAVTAPVAAAPVVGS